MKHDIVLVPFPFDDFSSQKVRPALCLTSRISGYDHVVIAFITSRIEKADEPSDLKLIKSGRDFTQTGLKMDSAIRLHRLVTVPHRLIRRRLGKLPESYHNGLRSRLITLFQL